MRMVLIVIVCTCRTPFSSFSSLFLCLSLPVENIVSYYGNVYRKLFSLSILFVVRVTWNFTSCYLLASIYSIIIYNQCTLDASKINFKPNVFLADFECVCFFQFDRFRFHQIVFFVCLICCVLVSAFFLCNRIDVVSTDRDCFATSFIFASHPRKFTMFLPIPLPPLHDAEKCFSLNYSNVLCWRSVLRRFFTRIQCIGSIVEKEFPQKKILKNSKCPNGVCFCCLRTVCLYSLTKFPFSIILTFCLYLFSRKGRSFVAIARGKPKRNNNKSRME